MADMKPVSDINSGTCRGVCVCLSEMDRDRVFAMCTDDFSLGDAELRGRGSRV